MMRGVAAKKLWLWLLFLQLPLFYFLLKSEHAMLLEEEQSTSVEDDRRGQFFTKPAIQQQQKRYLGRYHKHQQQAMRLQEQRPIIEENTAEEPPEEVREEVSEEAKDELLLTRQVLVHTEPKIKEEHSPEENLIVKQALKSEREKQATHSDIDGGERRNEKGSPEEEVKREETREKHKRKPTTDQEIISEVKNARQPSPDASEPSAKSETTLDSLTPMKKADEARAAQAASEEAEAASIVKEEQRTSLVKAQIGNPGPVKLYKPKTAKSDVPEPTAKSEATFDAHLEMKPVAKSKAAQLEGTPAFATRKEAKRAEKEEPKAQSKPNPTSTKKAQTPLQKTRMGNPGSTKPPINKPETNVSPPNQNKPNLVIHIGPSKTGTSTIQRESSYWPDPLAKDHYLYLGKFAENNYRRPAKIPVLLNQDECFEQAAKEYQTKKTQHFRETPCWVDRISGLDQHQRRGDNIILSDEAYSYTGFFSKKDADFFPMLKVALEDWNVTVVPTYRRYHEWYFSALKERNRKACLSMRGFSKAGQWPHQKGANPCLNLWKPIQKMIREDHWPGTNQYTPLDQSIPKWRDAGFAISILNFHAPEHITCAFYCDTIPHATHMCQHCRAQEGSNQNPTPAALTAYDDIVFEAAKRKMFPQQHLDSKSRSDTVAELVKYHTQTLNRNGLADLPLICPPRNELQAFLNKSLAFEQRILPDLYASPQGEKEHTEAFWKLAVEERTFCWVDKDAVLAGKTKWDQVLQALKNIKTWSVKTYDSSSMTI